MRASKDHSGAGYVEQARSRETDLEFEIVRGTYMLELQQGMQSIEQAPKELQLLGTGQLPHLPRFLKLRFHLQGTHPIH